jgi:hypothetical protein
MTLNEFIVSSLEAITFASHQIYAFFAEQTQKIQTAFIDGLTKMYASIQDTLGHMKSTLSSWGATITEQFQAMKDSCYQGLQTMSASIQDTLGHMKSTLFSWGTTITAQLQAMKDSCRQGFDSFLHSAADFFMSLAHYIKLFVGYAIIGPVVGIVSFFGPLEWLVMGVSILRAAMIGLPLVQALPLALTAGIIVGIASTMYTMYLNNNRAYFWENAMHCASSVINALFGIHAPHFKSSFEDLLRDHFERVQEESCTHTCLSQAIHCGITAAQRVEPECYTTAPEKEFIDKIDKFSKLGQIS